MLVVGPERRRQDEPARVAPRRRRRASRRGRALTRSSSASGVRQRGSRCAGRRAGVPLDLEVTLELGERQASDAQRRPPASRRAAARRGCDARLHARPAGGGQGRAGGAAGVLRPRARPAAPGRAGLPAEYAAAVGQRNAALRRVAQGVSLARRSSPGPSRSATLGSGARRRAGTRRSPRSSRRSPSGPASWACRAPARATRARRRPWRSSSSVSPATSSAARPALGPHLDEIRYLSAGRDLRAFGSQGEQRLAVLALLLAEAELLPRTPRHAAAAAARRRALGARPGPPADPRRPRSRPAGQALVTATSARRAARRAGAVLEVSPRPTAREVA